MLLGYTLNSDTYECYRQEQSCVDNGLAGVETLTVDNINYENCGARPTVSLYSGELQNLHPDNLAVVTMKGGCSADGQDNVQVAVEVPVEGGGGGSSVRKATASCQSGAWEVEMDLWQLIDKGEVFVVKAIHVDGMGRISLPAQSNINALCPDNYVRVSPLAGYTTAPFCVAKYEMANKKDNAIPAAALTPSSGRLTRNKAITRCSNVGSGYVLMTNDEWQTVARNIEGVSGNWGGGQGGAGNYLSVGNSSSKKLSASKDDNDACVGLTLGQGETCDFRTWHFNRRTFTLSNGQVIWDLAGNIWEWMKEDDGPLHGLDTYIAYLTENHNNKFGPAGDYRSLDWGSRRGGLGMMSASWGKRGAVRRGGSFGPKGGEYPGLFSLHVGSHPQTGSHAKRGFRCVYHLP